MKKHLYHGIHMILYSNKSYLDQDCLPGKHKYWKNPPMCQRAEVVQSSFPENIEAKRHISTVVFI